jgi:N-acetylmuramoyl-L-alanine amidase
VGLNAEYADTRDLGIDLDIDPGHGGADPGTARKIAPDATWYVEPEYHDKLIKESELTEEFALHIAGIAEFRALDHVIGSPPLRRT